MKKLVIIGFDGTIADTAPGILYCMNTTALSMGYTPVAHDALFGVIGVSLEQGFMNLYGMKDDEIDYAMNQYSKLYSIKGEEMILLYDGIEDSLKKLKESGGKTAEQSRRSWHGSPHWKMTFWDLSIRERSIIQRTASRRHMILTRRS